VKDGRFRSVAEQLALHRESANLQRVPQRSSIRSVLALDSFDVTGAWRIKDRGVTVDTRGELYDGTPIKDAAGLRRRSSHDPISWSRTSRRC
jgi:hypothetical protein